MLLGSTKLIIYTRLSLCCTKCIIKLLYYVIIINKQVKEQDSIVVNHYQLEFYFALKEFKNLIYNFTGRFGGKLEPYLNYIIIYDIPFIQSDIAVLIRYTF